MRALRQLEIEIKNIPGWRTNDKFVVFSVDDYGNVCLNSKTAKSALERGGVRLIKHIERLDALETKIDLEMLFDTLTSVKDSRGRSPVWTVNALCANPDFDKLAIDPSKYAYITLPETFGDYSETQPNAYQGAWSLWQEGIAKGYLRPQFHGREHINVELLMRKLRAHDRATLLNITNRSMVGISDDPSMPGVAPTHAFGVWSADSLGAQQEVLSDGVARFTEIFARTPDVIVPPGMVINPKLYAFVEALGFQAIDKPQFCKRNLAPGIQKREVNCLGMKRGQSHVTLVRNVVFEPTKLSSVDSVALAMKQIEAAFRWRKPAIISSHRVNFSGHIEPDNRKAGLSELRRLLKGIIGRWPEVQFIGTDELADRVRAMT